MVLPEWRHVSMRFMGGPIPTLDQCVASAAAFLGVMRYDQVRLAACDNVCMVGGWVWVGAWLDQGGLNPHR